VPLAVTAVADDRKGEKIVVLVAGEFDSHELVAKLQEGDLPKLWIPKADAFYKVEAIPLLGSGKLDLVSIKEKAREICGSSY